MMTSHAANAATANGTTLDTTNANTTNSSITATNTANSTTIPASTTNDESSSSDGSPPEDCLSLVLDNMTSQLTTFKHFLATPTMDTTLHNKLHNSNGLPDKNIAALAAKAVDVLHEVQLMLQPAQLILADHFLGFESTQCLVAAVSLRVPDLLAEHGMMSIGQLADAAGARRDRLGQVMRLLHSNGIFEGDADTGMYKNNFRSELLRSDHWTQWHNWVELYGNQFYDIARGIPASVREGTIRSAAQHNYDTDENMFTYFQKQGWVPLLHRTLGGGAVAQAPGIVADYPWHELGDKILLDVGGGGGGLVAALLRGNPSLRAGIFDLPAVIEHTRPFFQDGGQYGDIAGRVAQENLVGGDFFVNVPSHEVYVMKWCLHDWLDPDAIKILKNIRRAIVPGEGSRLIVLESIMTGGEMGRLSRYGDINMMMTANGQERTMYDWYQLARDSGWKISKVHKLRNAWVSAIDMRPE